MTDNATRERKIAATKARKAARVAAQNARMAKNIEALGDVYQPRATKTQYRWRKVREGKGEVFKMVAVTVSLSPSEQLNRWRYKYAPEIVVASV